MRGRKGRWRVASPVRHARPGRGRVYTEADAWQYAFAVAAGRSRHDRPLRRRCKGFIEKLDSLFVQDSTIHTSIPDITGLIGQFSQGDEQCHHVAYLYDYAGQPYKTQMRVRQVMSTLYSETPGGQCGNNDCGQMSAWYVAERDGLLPRQPGKRRL